MNIRDYQILHVDTNLREYDTVARADNYFAEYRMLFSRCRGNDIVG